MHSGIQPAEQRSAVRVQKKSHPDQKIDCREQICAWRRVPVSMTADGVQPRINEFSLAKRRDTEKRQSSRGALPCPPTGGRQS
jgi:hypothetical protein